VVPDRLRLAAAARPEGGQAGEGADGAEGEVGAHALSVSGDSVYQSSGGIISLSMGSPSSIMWAKAS
jgi:hypothetical protein